jgi:hypothetical protein
MLILYKLYDEKMMFADFLKAKLRHLCGDEYSLNTLIHISIKVSLYPQ